MSSGVHPEIGSLIREKDLMWNYMEQEDYLKALKKMKRILFDIRKKDNDNDLVASVKTEVKRLSRLGATVRRRRCKSMKDHYDDWAHQTVQILWDKGYLEEASYRPERKASKLKLQ